MGLLDAFGVGGGKLSIEPANTQAQPGGVLTGNIVYTGGKRAQNVTAIKATFSRSMTQTVAGPNGPQQSTQSAAVCGPITVTGAFTAQPGQRHAYPFQMQLPPNLPGTMQGQISYSLSASADIDGEIDPGASVQIQVIGGPAMGAMPGMMGGGMGAAAGAMGAMGAMGMGAMGAMPGQPVMNAPLAVGSQVMAQWQDGQFHPGVIVAMQNGMFGIDWSEPQLGASTWVQPHQVQQPAGMAMGALGMQPPIAPGAQPIAVGTQVMAQWQDGQFHPGVVVAIQNGMYGVDWTEPQLGASSWVQPHQLMASSGGMGAMGAMGGMMAKDAPKGGFAGQGMMAKDAPKDAWGGQGMMAKDAPKDAWGGQGMGGKDAAKDAWGGQGMMAKDAAKDAWGGQAMGDKGGFGGKDAWGDQGMGDKGGFGGKAAWGDQGMGDKGGGFGVTPGAIVQAQHYDGNWYPAKVIGSQNGMVGVEWTNPALGGATWLQASQVMGK